MTKINEDISCHAPVSCVSTEANKTGSWRYLTPHVEVKASPCEAACPLAIPIPDFIAEIENNRMEQALELIRMENPIPSVCGRVCIHPCEDRCSRGFYDRSIAIHMLERYAGDSLSSHIRMEKKTGKRIAVVGAGPSGLAAAYFLLIMGYDVTLFDANQEPGGILRYIIPEYRLPKEVLRSSLQAVFDLKPDYRKGMRLGENLSLDDLKDFHRVFLGTGAWSGKKGGIDAGEGKGVISGMEALKFIEEGELHRIGNRVLVIGGGNTAIDVARSLLRIGRKPLILYRRGIEDMPAFRQEIGEALREGVEIRSGVIVKEIIRDDDEVVGVRCLRVEFNRENPELRNSFEEIKGSGFYLDADQVILAIGEAPDSSIFQFGLETKDEKVLVDRYGRTSINNIYAGGDLVPQPHLVVYALASGKRAAIAIDAETCGFRQDDIFPSITIGERSVSFSMYRNLRGRLIKGESVDNNRPVQVSSPDAINLDYFEPMERTREKKLPLEKRKRSFEEVHIGYSGQGAQDESSRCFHCGRCILCDNCIIFCPDISILADLKQGRVNINLDYCKGCGLCAQECPRGVIRMEREVDR